MDSKLYEVISNDPDFIAGNRPALGIYREADYPKIVPNTKELKYDKETKAVSGILTVNDTKGQIRGTQRGRQYMVNIAFTAMGDLGPVVLFLHGVPTNRVQYYEIMKLMKPFCRCICIDMLGMGESQVKRNSKLDPFKTWLWSMDAEYIYNFMTAMYGNEKFIFVADDWGGGSLAHYAARYPKTLLNAIYIDPVAFDGYPVNEIQAIGRASPLSDEQFQMAMGAFDQTAIQIYKTMVHEPHKVWNQYSYRWIQAPYVAVDYSRAYSSTMQLNWNNLRNLADRAYVLGGPQLLPYHPTKNPMGVKYSQMEADTLILWGEYDNMMPEAQRHRFRNVISIATGGRVGVQTRQIPRAGHFAGLDQPDFVAASIMDYLMEKHSLEAFGDIFFGFNETILWKGDELEVIKDMRKMIFEDY